ncbi:MAG: divalent metal cation transporter, partial [Eudoraea sp.]|nr:divalent metal cation transporter [Eudoraea sp.]
GKSYLWIYTIITLVTTFTILAALYVVTAGLFINLFKIDDLSVATVALGLFTFISAVLIIGRYRFLELSLKFVVSILFLALLVTTILVLFKGQVDPAPGFTPSPIFNEVGILFLIGLVGWMPTAVEASSWISLWTLEKQKVTKRRLPLNEALQEFNSGYYMTALLAIFFLIIGWMTLYGTQTELSDNAVTFADQVVQLFTTHIGKWAYIFIAVSAFATMFSTCMTAHDAIARVSLDILKHLTPEHKDYSGKKYFAIGIIGLAIVNYIVLTAFSANMGMLVALATFISFVMAPVVGYMNLKNVMSKDLPGKFHPGKGLQYLTYAGILFLSLFALYYCWMILF